MNTNTDTLIDSAVSEDFEINESVDHEKSLPKSKFEKIAFSKEEFNIIKELRFKNRESDCYMYFIKVKSGYAIEISPETIGTYRWTGLQAKIIDGLIEKGYLKLDENSLDERYRLTIKARNLFDRQRAKSVIEHPLTVAYWPIEKVKQFISLAGYEIEKDDKDSLTLVCKNDELTSRHISHKHAITVNGHHLNRLHIATSAVINRLCKQQIEYILSRMYPVSSRRNDKKDNPNESI